MDIFLAILRGVLQAFLSRNSIERACIVERTISLIFWWYSLVIDSKDLVSRHVRSHFNNLPLLNFLHLLGTQDAIVLLCRWWIEIALMVSCGVFSRFFDVEIPTHKLIPLFTVVPCSFIDLLLTQNSKILKRWTLDVAWRLHTHIITGEDSRIEPILRLYDASISWLRLCHRLHQWVLLEDAQLLWSEACMSLYFMVFLDRNRT